MSTQQIEYENIEPSNNHMKIMSIHKEKKKKEINDVQSIESIFSWNHS